MHELKISSSNIFYYNNQFFKNLYSLLIHIVSIPCPILIKIHLNICMYLSSGINLKP